MGEARSLVRCNGARRMMIAFNLPDNSSFGFNLIPVNGGKTLLMQGIFAPGDGVITGTCQM